MALFDQPNQLVPGAPSNLPVVKPSAPPPPPPPPLRQGYAGQAPPPPLRSGYAGPTAPMPSMPPIAPSRIPEPEDIFSGTGHGPNIPRTPEALASIAESPAKGLGRKLVRLFFLALGAAVVVTAGYFGWNYIMGSPAAENIPPKADQPRADNGNVNLNENVNIPVNENVNVNVPANENANVNINAPVNENTNNPSIDMTTDTDKDGLSDYEETYIYHTDPLRTDTDNDGLSDRDEIMVWKTDSLDPDTDGDTYKDGEEVKNGYNPLGPGKLVPPVVQ